MEAGNVAFYKGKLAEPTRTQAGIDCTGWIVDCYGHEIGDGADSLSGAEFAGSSCPGKTGKHVGKDVVCGKTAGFVSYGSGSAEIVGVGGGADWTDPQFVSGSYL